MMHETRQQMAALGALAVLLAALAAPAAADPPDPAQALAEEVARLRQELAALRGQYEQRIAALEQRLAALESQTPQAAAPATLAGTPPVPPALAAAPTGGDQPAPTTLPVYGVPTTKILNPDIGVIGNLIGASGESRGGSDTVAPLRALTLQESEVSLQAIVDPYARADFFLAVGEEGLEVEEGYATFPTVPGGFLVKAGKMRATFGRLNAFHNHSLPWIDRPLVMVNLLGGATDDPDTGIKDAGVSVSRLVPAGRLFLEATGEVFRGESGTLFAASRRRDVALLGRLRAYTDLTDQTNLEIGTSYARGHNEHGSGFLTQLYGIDLTLRWKPLRRAIYRSFGARSEIIWSRRDQPDGRQDALGAFASADYQFARRWWLGGRWDWSERAQDATLRDHGLSLVLTYWPSEFSQIRSQYRRTRYADRGVANELLFQVLFTIGAHGAHPF
jgi:hypothetical protein